MLVFPQPGNPQQKLAALLPHIKAPLLFCAHLLRFADTLSPPISLMSKTVCYWPCSGLPFSPRSIFFGHSGLHCLPGVLCPSFHFTPIMDPFQTLCRPVFSFLTQHTPPFVHTKNFFPTPPPLFFPVLLSFRFFLPCRKIRKNFHTLVIFA